MPTRLSWSLTSLGTPMTIGPPEACTQMLEDNKEGEIGVEKATATGGLFWPIDLRALQAVRVVDVKRLPLAVEFDSANSAFAVAVACRLCSAKRQVHFRADGRRVHVR